MKVLLGVCGGIAAYKAAEIVRALQDRGAEVDVAMTASAQRFITPLTFNALTGRPVHTSHWAPDQSEHADGPIEHIAVAQTADVLLVAPASAHTLARFAHGLADDFLSAVYLATAAPVILAPAMNVNMWHHPATVANVERLRERGVHFVEPEAGYLACGMTGGGRLAPVASIVDATLAALRPRNHPASHDLHGETVLITAGGTREPLDPVRFLGNRSSGRMGHALAEAASARGARVLLVTASSLPTPSGCEVHRVDTAASMEAALQAQLPAATILIAAAAVADFRPVAPSLQKIRRTGPLTLHLEPTPDLLVGAVQRRRPGMLIVGFAAETEALEQNARTKLLRKGLDALVANDVSLPDTGFDVDQNAGLFLTPARTVPLLLQPKRQMADAILNEIATLRRTQTSAPIASTPELQELLSGDL